MGLRAEHSSTSYERSDADTFEHSYLSLFPSANLSYNPNFYLVQDNQQTSRAYQIDLTYRF